MKKGNKDHAGGIGLCNNYEIKGGNFERKMMDHLKSCVRSWQVVACIIRVLFPSSVAGDNKLGNRMLI